MADHDALLGISRLIRQRAPTESHLLHHDHDRVRQLILHTLQGDFAGISAPTSVSSSSSVISPWSAASLLWPQIKTPWASSRSCATRGGCLPIYQSRRDRITHANVTGVARAQTSANSRLPTLDGQRAGNRQAVRSRISLTSSIDVSGCRKAKRPTVSPSHLVGGTNAISSSCNACAHLL
jgi:hypothetical protein